MVLIYEVNILVSVSPHVCNRAFVLLLTWELGQTTRLILAQEVHLEVAVEVGPLVAQDAADHVHAVLRAAGRLRRAPVEVPDQLT